MDNLWGYFQLPLSPRAQQLSAIVTPWGLYIWHFCPFGLSTAPVYYQEAMANILGNLILNGVIVYIDDTLVYAKSPEQFLVVLRLALSRMLKANVRLKASKCYFGFREITFLGHVFNAEGCRLSDERKQGILDMAVPRTLKQLRSFLGAVNYFRDFVPNLSGLLVPLTDLTKTSKNHLFEWNSEAETAFHAVKDAIRAAVSLGHITDNDPMILYTDASTIAIGFVLKQLQHAVNGETIEVIIGIGSQKLSDAARRWTTIELELFAIVTGVLKNQSYLLGRRFTIATDHRNLVYLENSTIPKLVRWRLRLLEFSYSVIHVPGTENIIADAASRLYSLESIDVEHLDILKSVHNSIVGHFGITYTIKMLEDFKLINNWPSYRSDVKDFIKSCAICQKIKPAPIVLAPITHHIHGTYPMDSLSIDTIGPLPEDEYGNMFILAIVDNFSKYTNLYPSFGPTSKAYLSGLIHHIGIFGVPTTIRTDQGSQFTSKLAEELSLLLQFNHLKVVPYTPQANGLVERKNREIMKHLRAIVLDQRVGTEWSLYLPMIQRIINGSYDRTIGATPNRIIFGDMLKLSMPLLVSVDNTFRPTEDYLSTLKAKQELFISLSKAHLEKESAKIPTIGASLKVFTPGDYVLLTYPSNYPPSKLSPRLRGPFIVIEKLHDSIYRVQDLISNKSLDVHINRMIEFAAPASITPVDLIALAATDQDEFIVEAILAHRGNAKKKSSLEFLIKWQGYEDEFNTWEPYSLVKDLQLLDQYAQQHPNLRI
jgi:cleavage and polyadenylation specificity factor subunit 1